jgi:hypothetical protein
MAISLTDAIASLRRDLREALTKAEPDIVFTPGPIELELGVTFAQENSLGGGIKAYIFDFSAGAKGTQTDSHKVKITLQVSGPGGKPLKLSGSDLPSNASP